MSTEDKQWFRESFTAYPQPDDWAVVEEALHYALLRVGRQLGWQEAADTYKDGKAALARLREREAQLTLYEKIGPEAIRRAEAAEAEVVRWRKAAVDEQEKRMKAEADRKVQYEAAMAAIGRAAQLEEALREIAENTPWGQVSHIEAVARRALAGGRPLTSDDLYPYPPPPSVAHKEEK